MPVLRDRLALKSNETVIRLTGTPVAALLARLEAGERASDVVNAEGIDPLDLIAALSHAALGQTPAPSLVQTSPARPWLERTLAEPSLAGLLPGLARPSRLALASGLLQVHDFWDASHTAAQEAEDRGERDVSPYWHGIAHRREPDPGNASYWFRRVGRHRVFPSLAAAARPLIEGREPSLADRLLPGGEWDLFAFIDFCTRATGPNADLARALQRVEMELLMDATVQASN